MTKQADSAVPRCVPAWRSAVAVLALGVVAWWLLPDQLGLQTRIAFTALFVLSLDLVVGVAGSATLGHAAMFGVGAYAVPLLCVMFVLGPPLRYAWDLIRHRKAKQEPLF